MAYMILEKTTGDTCGDGRIDLPFRWRVKESTFEKPLPSQDIVGMEFTEAIPITQEDIENFPNEFRVDRIGSCNKCGYCCEWIKNKAADHCCAHIVRAGPNKGECEIYESLGDWCETCQDDHSTCIPPPHQPYPLDICGYKWIVATIGLPITDKEISRIYWAKDKDLTGKWIRE